MFCSLPFHLSLVSVDSKEILMQNRQKYLKLFWVRTEKDNVQSGTLVAMGWHRKQIIIIRKFDEK